MSATQGPTPRQRPSAHTAAGVPPTTVNGNKGAAASAAPTTSEAGPTLYPSPPPPAPPSPPASTPLPASSPSSPQSALKLAVHEPPIHEPANNQPADNQPAINELAVDDPDSSVEDNATVLTPRQEQAAIAFVTCPTNASAVQAAGVSEATLWRWRQLPAFPKRCRELQRELRSHTSAILQASAVEAAQVLHSIAVDTQAPPGSRVTAARLTLEWAFRATQMDDMAADIEELKEELAKHTKTKTDGAGGAP
jgi:hypothetical protein